MIEALSYPVFSAFLGAVALRLVERIEDKRSAITGLHHEFVSNYYRLQGTIEDTRRDRWQEEYARIVSVDAIESVRRGNPTFQRTLVQEVDGFVPGIAATESIQQEQLNSRRPDAYIEDDPEELRNRLKRVQKDLLAAEEGLREYRSSSLLRRVIFWRTIEGDAPEANREVIDMSDLGKQTEKAA